MSELQTKADASGESRIEDLTYRNYDGPIRVRFFRGGVIAAQSLRLLWSRPWFYILPSIVMVRFLFAWLWIYVTSQVSVQLGQPLRNYAGEPAGQYFALHFWSAQCGDMNSLILLIVTLLAGAGSIAADNRSNALLVYLSKPITKLDYLIGKWLSVFASLFVVMLVPAAALYAACMVSFRDLGFLDERWLGPRMLLAVLVPAALHASLIVGISAWSKSPRIVGAVYASLYIVSGVLAYFIGAVIYKNSPELRNMVQHLSLRGLIIGIDQRILRLEVPPPLFTLRRRNSVDATPMPTLWPLLTLFCALLLGSVTAAWAKIRAVQVVRG